MVDEEVLVMLSLVWSLVWRGWKGVMCWRRCRQVTVLSRLELVSRRRLR